MNVAVREALRRHLSPQTYQRVRSWWRHRLYWPSLTASVFIKRRPIIYGFPSDCASHLVNQIRSVNVLAPTKMCRVMNRYGSDKGVGGRHNYTPIYSALFGNLCSQQLRIFELGLGTNNTKIAANMGVDGTPGASLRGWKELFPNALVFGADIDRDVLFEEDRIKTFYCDQVDTVAVHELWSQPALQGGMDIIIEDGMHTFESSISFFKGSIGHLRPGGVYVIEDILKKALGRWREVLGADLPARFPNHEFALVELPDSFNRYDNNLLIVRRNR